MENKIDTLKIFLEFLEVSIHNILFLRKLYPDGIFTLKKKYGVPVHVSLYPDLNGYITESLHSLKKLISCHDFRQLDLCFYDNREKPVERYVFSLASLKPQLPPEELLDGSDPYLTRLQESLRAFCLKLAVSTSYLKALPQDTTFRILMHTSEPVFHSLSQDPLLQDFPFVEVETQEMSFDNAVIVPVYSFDTELFKIETYIEESSR